MAESLFAAYQFLDANSLNSLVGNVSGSIATLASGSFIPGLRYPDTTTLTVSGLSVTSVFSPQFQILFGTGVLSTAHGVTTGQDTQTYVTSFSTIIPTGASTVTGYLLASYTQIQQGQYTIIGPPPGHPDFNPNYIPQIAYSMNVDSFSLTTSTTPPDNVSTFEIARAILTSGTTTAMLQTQYQNRYSVARDFPVTAVTSGATGFVTSQAGKFIEILNDGATYTLPSTWTANGLTYQICYSPSSVPGSGIIAINANSTLNPSTGIADLIYGAGVNGGVPVSGVALTKSSVLTLKAVNGRWQTIGNVVQPLTQNLNLYVKSNTGNDSNNGLSVATAFKTLQHATNVAISSYNLNGYSIIINIYGGLSYTNSYMNGPPTGNTQSYAGIQYVTIGGTGTATVNGSGSCFLAQNGAEFYLNGSFNLSQTNATSDPDGGVVALNGSRIQIGFSGGTTTFLGAQGSHIISAFGSSVGATLYQVGGSATYHWYAQTQGNITVLGGGVNMTTNVAFTAWANAYDCGVIDCGGLVFGSKASVLSGLEYAVSTNGVINTAGGGALYLPGSGVSVSSGGQYV